MVTLRQALKIGGLKHCKVRAGHAGIENKLKHVTIMEVPDIVRWLKGEELMLTSLYSIKNDKEAQQNLVKSLYDKGTSALAIKPHRFIDDIPQILLDEAEKYSFPIIEIPEVVSYLDILSPVMTEILGDKVVHHEDLQQAYQLLNEISNNKSGIDSLKNTLIDLLKRDVLIESFMFYGPELTDAKELKPLSSVQKEELELIQRPIRMERDNISNEKASCIVAPIIIDGMLYGTINSIGDEQDFMDVDIAILERAATILAMEFMRMKVTNELEQQYKSEFFRDLFSSSIQSEEMIVEKGAIYGFDLKRHYLCIAIHYNFDKKGIKSVANMVNQLELILYQWEKKAIIGAFQNGIYILLPTVGKKGDRISRDINGIYTELEKAFPTNFYMGIGRSYRDVKGIRNSYEQAERAVILGRILFSERQMINYEDLGVYRLLGEVKNTEELLGFYEESVAPIVEYDKESDMELVTTLRAYFDNNESISKTAKSLFVHVNTLKYRLQKIKNLTHHNIQVSEEKLMLQLGLKVYDFIKNDYRFR